MGYENEAKRMNAVFEKHGLSIIPVGTRDWAPIMADNLEALSKRVAPDWATHFYGGDKAYVLAAGNDIYQEIPK